MVIAYRRLVTVLAPVFNEIRQVAPFLIPTPPPHQIPAQPPRPHRAQHPPNRRVPVQQLQQPLRRSQRIRKSPDRLTL